VQRCKHSRVCASVHGMSQSTHPRATSCPCT
jgi:hypothetical protein